ncbi:hypothetical protein LF887_07225 [Chryseobacterium sp. MEBOG06]|uniref:hypothetical protein n=1 Tax=Chryseobacterium sp. MEBOG06 TaxID=2879938 RepID=UPI001F3698BE|nr:hypothetical protein [Chryseobacterium sp. MEBOG06]UKB85405.1 hypothetical protein LF887_07225 [Chryseobacterium sp. MEBOG06]
MNNIQLLEKYKDYTLDKIEDLLSCMRRKDDLSMMQSAMLLVFKFKLTIKEADNYILNSDTWKDSKDSVNKLRNNISNSID